MTRRVWRARRGCCMGSDAGAAVVVGGARVKEGFVK